MTQIRLFTLTAVAMLVCQLGFAEILPEDATPVAKPESKLAPVTAPRVILGNDQVIAPAKPSAAIEGPPIAFKFEEAPIVDVVNMVLRDILKVDYVMHPPLNGAVTLATRGEIPPDKAMALLESALQANGILMAKDARGTYHVGRPEALKGIVAAPRQFGNGPLPPGYGAVIISLKYIGAGEMASILRPMVQPDSILRVDSLRNLLVMSGTRLQAEGWLDIVSTFDVDLLAGMSVGVFPLKYATTKDVELALRLMSPGGAAAAATSSSAVPNPVSTPAATSAAAMLAEGNPLFGAIRVLPIERMNSIIVVTPRAAYLEQARKWIEKLDRPSSNATEAELFVYPVQNGSAKHLAGLLTSIYGGSPVGGTANPTGNGVAPSLTPLSSSTGAFGAQGSTMGAFGSQGAGGNPALNSNAQQGNAAAQNGQMVAAMLGKTVRIVADTLNNAVLVYSTPSEFAKIEATLKRLDVPQTQVLIEASIIEVTLADSLQYGLQWAFTGSGGGRGLTGTGLLSNNGNTALAASTATSTANSGVFGSVGAGFSYALTNPLGNVRAVLNALADKSLVKVISSPYVMVLDNQTAAINVGTQQPVQSGQTVSTLGTSISTSIVYQPTGVILSVTPSVNAGNVVTMDISQNLTDVGAIDSATQQRSFLQRQMKSTVSVRSGETLVMGGLISDNTTTDKSGLPILSSIPVLGALFGTQTKNVNRTELLVVITPRVVRSDQELREVTSEMRERMKALSTIDALKESGLPLGGQDQRTVNNPPPEPQGSILK